METDFWKGLFYFTKYVNVSERSDGLRTLILKILIWRKASRMVSQYNGKERENLWLRLE